MNAIGTVESLWRYPVKSMRGEELNEAFVARSLLSLLLLSSLSSQMHAKRDFMQAVWHQ
jgi:uncharacterized protein YcbX